MSTIRIKKQRPWSSVPDAVLEDASMTFPARLTLAWMLGRPNDWEIHVSHLIRTLGLTDRIWPRVRRELVARQFFRQQRLKGNDGKFVWINEVTDAPLYLTSDPRITIPTFCRDGDRRDAKRRDIPLSLDQNNLTTLPPHPPTPSEVACSSTRGDGGMTDVEIDYSNLKGVSAALARCPRLKPLLQSGGQVLADALEASIRWGIRSDNPVKFPERIVEKALLSLPIEELEARGSEVRQERQQRRAIDAAHENAAKRILDDPKASEKGKVLINQLRKKREQGVQSHPI